MTSTTLIETAYSLPVPPAGIETITVSELREAARDGREIAVVDVREGQHWLAGHISIAVELPYGEIALQAPRLLPRRTVRVVVSDDDGGELAQAAARRLIDLGYTDVRILAGGLEEWTHLGFELITGQFSLSKALGEFVERTDHTPRITVDALKARIDSGEKLVILDTRPLEEFNYISIPGGIAAPGAELLYRVFEAVPSPDTPVVINCAGRTRAIIGAQALLNAGFPNPIVSLENGTSAWLLAGYEPGRGETRAVGTPSPAALEKAKAAGAHVAERFGVSTITREQLDAFRAEAGEHTLYLFDVRTKEEFLAGHVPGARSAPGGQLVQTTDRFVGVRQARIVLVDDPDLVRSRITASWLIQMDLPHVHVYPASPAELTEQGAERIDIAGLPADVASVTAPELQQHLADGTTVLIDLEPAPPYYRTRTYIPGSLVGQAASLPRRLAQIPGTGRIVVTSANGVAARFAAEALAAVTTRPVAALDGGTDAWIAAGLPVAQGLDQPGLDPSEALPGLPTLDERRVTLAAYVRWGDHITDQLTRDGLVTFRKAAH